MIGTRINVSLKRYDVGITGAIPGRESWSEPAMDRAILEFVALLTSIIFKYGGRIVHGSHPSLTPIIIRQARLHAGARDKKPVCLVMSELWAKDLTSEFQAENRDVAELVITDQVGIGGPENTDTRNRSLTHMRRELIDRQNVMVAVGGKMHAQDGIRPGLGEELDMAAEKGIPRFLVAGMGGFAASYAQELAPSSLLNGLSQEENAELFGTTDVSACVSIVFERLCNMPSNI